MNLFFIDGVSRVGNGSFSSSKYLSNDASSRLFCSCFVFRDTDSSSCYMDPVSVSCIVFRILLYINMNKLHSHVLFFTMDY